MNQSSGQAGEFTNPDRIVEELGIESGAAVADFGCGTGFFVFPIAKKVGNGGRVFALDVLKEKLEAVDGQAKLQGFNNIIVKRVNLEKDGGSGLESESLDWVLITNMLFQNNDKEVIIKEAERVLKPSGKMVVIDWNEKESAIGPSKNLRLSRKALLEMLKKSGLNVLKELNVSEYHYCFVVSR